MWWPCLIIPSQSVWDPVLWLHPADNIPQFSSKLCVSNKLQQMQQLNNLVAIGWVFKKMSRADFFFFFLDSNCITLTLLKAFSHSSQVSQSDNDSPAYQRIHRLNSLEVTFWRFKACGKFGLTKVFLSAPRYEWCAPLTLKLMTQTFCTHSPCIINQYIKFGHKFGGLGVKKTCIISKHLISHCNFDNETTQPFAEHSCLVATSPAVTGGSNHRNLNFLTTAHTSHHVQARSAIPANQVWLQKVWWFSSFFVRTHEQDHWFQYTFTLLCIYN